MIDTQLTAEEAKIFDQFYQRQIAEAGGARDDAQELEIAQDILLAVINDGLTLTSDGGASYVRRGAIDWTDPATLQAAQATMSQTERTRPMTITPIPNSGPKPSPIPGSIYGSYTSSQPLTPEKVTDRINIEGQDRPVVIKRLMTSPITHRRRADAVFFAKRLKSGGRWWTMTCESGWRLQWMKV